MDTLQKDIVNLSAGLSEGLERLQYGSFADRNPALGKMERCQFCHKRRRQFSIDRCCNPSHATTQRAWDEEKGFYQAECPPRVIAQDVPKSMIKKLLHKRHSNKRRLRIHELTLLFQNEPKWLLAAAKEMHVKAPDLSGIPPFAEKYILWSRERRDRKLRKMQKESRRINAI